MSSKGVNLLLWNVEIGWERKQMNLKSQYLPPLFDKMDGMIWYAFCIAKFNYSDMNCPPEVDDCFLSYFTFQIVTLIDPGKV